MTTEATKRGRGRPRNDNVRVNVTFYPETHKRIKEFSKEEQRDFSNMVNLIINQFFDQKDAENVGS